jgi:hypothetical protein
MSNQSRFKSQARAETDFFWLCYGNWIEHIGRIDQGISVERRLQRRMNDVMVEIQVK